MKRRPSASAALPGRTPSPASPAPGADAVLPELEIEEPAGARAGLAVDDAHVAAAQICSAADAARVPPLDREPRAPAGEVDHQEVAARQKRAHEGQVELAGALVEEVAPRDVPLPPPHPPQRP